MSGFVGIIELFPMVFSFLLGPLADSAAQFKTEAGSDIGRTRGLEIILVVDVSVTMTDSLDLIQEFVALVYDSLARPEKDDIRLITFSDRAILYNGTATVDSAILYIRNENTRANAKSRLEQLTFPKYGFSEVFRLTRDGFPKKVESILFVSDGEDNSHHRPEVADDLKEIVEALINTGMPCYSIFVPTAPTTNLEMRRKRMQEIAKLAVTESFYELENSKDIIKSIITPIKKRLWETNFTSPVSRIEFNSTRASWEEKNRILETAFGENTKKFEAERRYFIAGLGILIVMVVSLSIMQIRQVILLKHSGENKESRRISLEKLWGKLEYRRNGKVSSIKLYDESVKSNPCRINVPDSSVCLECATIDFQNKKAIKIDMPAGGYYKLLNEDGSPCENQYIDSKTRYIEVFRSKSKPFKFEYRFLDKLTESYKPVWGEGLIGRKDIIDEIKGNFLRPDRQYHHCIISGMGNAGKSSLIKHLREIVFQEDAFAQRYATELVDFWEFKQEMEKKGTKAKFLDFQRHLDNKLMQLNVKHKKKERIVFFIDEYDKAIEEYQDDFCKLMSNYERDQHMLFVLAGKKSVDPLFEACAQEVLTYKTSIVLPPIDDFGGVPNKNGINELTNSVKLIDYVLSDMGFGNDYLSDDLKKSIAFFSSGFPYLIKRILYELIHEWLDDYGKHQLQMGDVENAVSKVIQPAIDSTIKVVCNYDEMGRQIENIRRGEVPARDIVNALARLGKGKAKKSEIRNRVIENPIDDKVKMAKEQSFDEKLKQLVNMHFVIEHGEYLVGIPHLCFYRGEQVV